MNGSKFGYTFIVLASVVIILAGIKSASSIIVPFLLAFFVSIILLSIINYLRLKSIPSFMATLIVLVVFIVSILFLGKLISTSAIDFSQNINEYAQKLNYVVSDLTLYADKFGYEISEQSVEELINTKQIMRLTSSMIQGMGGIFSNGFVILLMILFMLSESQIFVKKINLIFQDSVSHIEQISEDIKQYMLIKTIMSLITAVLIYVSLKLIGTDYPLLWAVLAFFLNFIPNIGSIIAALPTVLITLVQLGFMSSLAVAVVYLVVNILIGSILEPKVMGKGLGISTLVVFLSLIFWGWLLGIVGMFLSIPLTIILKIILQANENTKRFALLLDNEVSLVNKNKTQENV